MGDSPPDPYGERFKALFLKVEALLGRPDIAAIISRHSADQLVTIRNFARSWDAHAVHLTSEQKEAYFLKLDEAVRALTHHVTELDQLRLNTLPVNQMGQA